MLVVVVGVWRFYECGGEVRVEEGRKQERDSGSKRSSSSRFCMRSRVATKPGLLQLSVILTT